MRLGKTRKKQTPDRKVILERKMVGLVQMIALDQERCVGCRDCQSICPVEAVTSSEPVIEAGSLTACISMDIDPDLCHFCGQCAVICPTRAISWQEGDEVIPDIVANGIFPILEEKVHIQIDKCMPDCQLACEQSCSVGAMKVEIHPDPETGKDRIVAVLVDERHCFYCHRCEKACPYDAIQVACARDGIVVFAPGNCLEGCHACAEICPSDALSLEDSQVVLDEGACIFCRACQNVCPVDDALEIRRERIRHHPVRSQLWVEIQGKLVSNSAKARLMEETALRKRDRAFRTRID